MREGEIINGYKILEDFRVVGGMSKISFAEKGGKTYFIKEFLMPKYPTPDSPGSEKTKEKKRRACNEFERHHKELNNAIGKCCTGMGGNLVYAIDFFRNGASYYKVTEKIDISSFPCENIAKLPLEKILLIAKSASHSIKILHGQKIVHGDLKPDNLPIKEVKKGYVVKLIDFDDSYFECHPPVDRESLVGTPEYYSPEQAAYIMDEDDEIEGNTLTCKSDIFTLGIIFSEYFSGRKPILSGGYTSTWNCVKNSKSFSFSATMPHQIEELIRKMLSLNPSDRPTITEVFNVLQTLKVEEKPIGIDHVLDKKTVLRFGPGFNPVSPTSERPIPLEAEKSDDTNRGKPSKPKSTDALRGSGLKIINK